MKETIDSIVDNLTKNMTPNKVKAIGLVGGLLFGMADFANGDYTIRSAQYFTKGLPMSFIASVTAYGVSGKPKSIMITGVPLYTGYLVGEIIGYFLR